MKWIIHPFQTFTVTSAQLEEPTDCAGGGTLTTHCSCIGCLVVCGPTPNSFVIKQ
jgi:hypothetical protein